MTDQQQADIIIDSDGSVAPYWRELISDWHLVLRSASATEAVFVAPDGDEIVLRSEGRWTMRNNTNSCSGVGWYQLWDGGRG
jgi:hypothetical protein